MNQHALNSRIRKAIAIIAIGLPIILYCGGKVIFNLDLEVSFSAYYHTAMQDVFVGLLCMFGILLIIDNQYRGNGYFLTSTAGILAIAISLLPTQADSLSTPSLINILHSLFALLFFIIIAIVCLRIFTQEINKPCLSIPFFIPIKRLSLYKVCAYIILLSVSAFIMIALLPQATGRVFQGYHATFWLKTLANTSLGLAWITKAYDTPGSIIREDLS